MRGSQTHDRQLACPHVGPMMPEAERVLFGLNTVGPDCNAQTVVKRTDFPLVPPPRMHRRFASGDWPSQPSSLWCGDGKDPVSVFLGVR